MHIYRITVTRVTMSYNELPDKTEVIMTAEFTGLETDFAYAMYAHLCTTPHRVYFERIDKISKRIDGKRALEDSNWTTV